MSVSFRPSRKKRDFCGEDNELPSLSIKKTRQIPPQNGFHLQGCSQNRIGLLIAVKDLFPMIDQETIEAVLHESGENVDAAIEKLRSLHLNGNQGQMVDLPLPQTTSDEDTGEQTVLHDWVKTAAVDVRLSQNDQDLERRMENAGRSLMSRTIEHYKTHSQEMKSARKEFDAMRRTSALLCKAMSKKQEADKVVQLEQELTRAKETLHQKEEKIKSLELSNYALTVHLQRAFGHNNSDNSGPPDIF